MKSGNDIEPPEAGPKLKCKRCQDVIQSMYRHDFKECTCGAIFIDGGTDYIRCGGNPEDMEWIKDE